MRRAWRDDLAQAKDEVLRVMSEANTPVPPLMVIESVVTAGVRPEMAKRAIWYLMDEGAVFWWRNRTLSLTEEAAVTPSPRGIYAGCDSDAILAPQTDGETGRATEPASPDGLPELSRSR